MDINKQFIFSSLIVYDTNQKHSNTYTSSFPIKMQGSKSSQEFGASKLNQNHCIQASKELD